MKNNNEKISILVANYNNGKYLEECIESVLSQTVDNWELYIVDDESRDNSKDVYNKYSDNKKIKIFYNKKNLGYTATLKKLIDLASTDIVGILDADDKLDSTAIEKVLNKYSKYYKAGFVYTNFWFCDKNMNIEKLGFCKPIPKGYSNLDSISSSHFKTFRKSIYEKTAGYDESILYAEDKDLVYKMEEVTRLHFVNEPLYYYRELDNSESHGDKKSKISYSNFQKAKQNAYKRRGLPNRDNLFAKIINLDFDYSRKRKIRKAPLAIDKNDGIENLISAKKIFNELGVNYWLTDGTLLGYYREHDFIKHDFDLDIGCFIKDFNDEIIMKFLDEDWKLFKVLGKKDLGLEITFIRDFLKLDIFFFYAENGKYWHAAWDETKRGLNLIKYYYDPFELKTDIFLNHEFSVPKDTLKYITTKYGKSWNEPIKNWDWADGPSNSKRTSVFL